MDLSHIDAIQGLSLLISYYVSVQNKLSPLMPKWANALLKKESGALEKEIQNSRAGFSKDQYLAWLLKEKRGVLI